jgi:predicted nucleic acid-binding protein
VTVSVLTEFLSHTSKLPENLRRRSLALAESLQTDSHTKVIFETEEFFKRGFSFLSKRLYTDYSLVDCISMEVMREYSIQNILTNDAHFTREGFNILIR